MDELTDLVTTTFKCSVCGFEEEFSGEESYDCDFWADFRGWGLTKDNKDLCPKHEDEYAEWLKDQEEEE